MEWVGLGIIGVILCFGLVIMVGPPYLPTLDEQVTIALDMLDLKQGQTMLELGCGDGKVLIAAAERGWQAVGYELNPLLVLVAWLRTRRYGNQVRVVWGNLWQISRWPQADGIFVFMLQKYMSKLDYEVAAWHRRPVKLVSFAFHIEGKKPIMAKKGLFLYYYH